MVNACSAYGCSTRAAPASGVSFHSYPLQDAALLEKWKRANPRKDFEPTKHSKICSRHFHLYDFIEASADTNSTRKNRRSESLSRRCLKPGAVPSIFPNAPVYLSADKKAPRATTATASERLEREQRDLEERIGVFQKADSIAEMGLREIQCKLEQEATRPSGFQTAIQDDKLCIYMLETQPVCRVSCYVCLEKDLTVTYGANGLPLRAGMFSDLLTGGKALNLGQLVNLMSRIKNWTEDSRSADSSPEMKVCSLLDAAQDLLEQAEGLTDNRTVSFALEQLKLSRKSSCTRRYSEDLLVFSYLIYSISASAYKTMLEQDANCLPSDRTLRSITARVGSSSGLDSEAYLQLRASKLSQMEKVVTLVIDEIYNASRVEYSNGQLCGIDEDGARASTLCCFMIKSVAGEFKDMVAMHAVSALTAKKLSDWFQQVMKVLRKLSATV